VIPGEWKELCGLPEDSLQGTTRPLNDVRDAEQAVQLLHAYFELMSELALAITFLAG
jgi:hypothetical protein